MKEKNKIFILLFILLAAFANRGFAQKQVEVMANYVFATDSLVGFDEPAASAEALAGSFFGREYKVHMYLAKRTFIKQKYNLKSAPAPQVTLFQNNVAQRTSAAGIGACNNEDFELAAGTILAPGLVQGWTVGSGTNFNSCVPPNITAAQFYTVNTAPVVDEITGLLVSSYFDASTNNVPAGNAFIRLNESINGADAVKLTKQFIVGPTNALFQYAYFPVIEDGGHLCCEQAGFNIRITVTNTASGTSSVLACPQISVAVPSQLCQYVPPAGSPVFQAAPLAPGWSYHPWAASAIDLTPYLGNQVTLDVTVVDCNAGGHAGYAYFDAKCAPMDIMGNGTAFPAGTPSVTLPTCGATSATICAPSGLGPYSWAGPGVVNPYNLPLNTNQCYTTSISADFTLSMNPPGSCSPIERVITVTITPAPFILANVTQAACGGTSATISWTAAGSASVNPTITFTPSPSSSNTTAVNLGTAVYPAGTGIVTITAEDPLGCKVSTTVDIRPVPPTPTVAILNITGSPSVTCLTPSITLQAVSNYTFNPLTFYWSSNSFSASTQSITVTSASTLITLNATDPVTGCVATATTSIGMNITPPVSSVSPVSQNIPCGPGVVTTATGVAISPTTNVTHSWYSPFSPQPTTGGGQISINGLGGPGTYTYVLTNNINGCSTTKTIEVISTGGTYPTFDLTSIGNFTLGCSTKSVTDITIANGQVPPSGGSVSYTVLPPSFAGGTYTYGTQNVYNVTTPGTYTVIVKSNSNNCETAIPISIIQNTFSPNLGTSVITRTLSCDVPTVVLTGTSSTSPVTYTWSFQNGSNPNSQVSNTISVNTTTSGAATPSGTLLNTYTLTIRDMNNFCITTSVVPMWQNTRPPIPSIAMNGGSLTCAVFSVNLTNNSSTGILPGTFTTFQPIGGFLWQGPTPQLPKSNSSTYLGYTPGVYTLTAIDLNNGCKSQTTAVIADNRIYPVLTANTLIPLDCGASNTGGVKLGVIAQGLPTSSITVVWTYPSPPPNVSGANTLTLTTDAPGEYKILVTNNVNKCASTKFITVTNGSLTADFTPDVLEGFAPLTVNFTNNSASTSTSSATSSITTVWSFGNGTTRTTSTNITTSAVYNAPGTYSITIFTRKGACLDTMTKTIVVDIPSKLEVPNVFTPNGDNNNDLFFVKSANLTNISAQIFDRWGNKVYELDTDKGNIAWDGKNQSGKEVAAGVYFYTIKATGRDGQSYDTKGTVSLFR